MSNYTQIVAFGPKDALISGNPLKLIKGVEIDAELAAIGVAISSKVDSTTLSANAGILADLGGLADPGADRILFWDFSAGAAAFLTAGSGLTITGTTISATAGGGGDALTTQPLSQFAATTSAQLAGVMTNETGSGSLVFATGPTLVAPVLGVVAAGSVLTNATGLPISTGVSGLGAGVATFLATPSSANLATAVTGETGTGALVFANGPTFVAPILGQPASGDLSLCTGVTAREVTKYKTAQQDSTTTTLVDDTHLSAFALDASSYYRVEAYLAANFTDAAGEFQAAMQTSSAFTSSHWTASIVSATGRALQDSWSSAATTTTQPLITSFSGVHSIVLSGVIVTNGAATVDFQWSQRVASGTSSLLVGSWMRITKMS